MVKEIQYINIKEILSRVMRHPLLQDVTLEQAVQYVLDFIGVFGLPSFYENKEAKVHITEYRGALPCDCIAINQVMEEKSGKCLIAMTSTFSPDEKRAQQMAFKTQGQVIFTSFKEGDIIISYRAIPVDDEGFPLLVDDPVYLRALEAYIKQEVFTILFDMGKIHGQVLNNTQQDYSFKAGQLQSQFTIPSVSEMQSLTNMWCTMIPRMTEFDKGFVNLGDREYLKRH